MEKYIPNQNGILKIGCIGSNGYDPENLRKQIHELAEKMDLKNEFIDDEDGNKFITIEVSKPYNQGLTFGTAFNVDSDGTDDKNLLYFIYREIIDFFVIEII